MSEHTHLLTGLRARRVAQRLSAPQMAKVIGMTSTSYLRFERGERRVYLDKAVALARYLGCTIAQLAQEPTVDEQVEALRLKLEAERAGDTVEDHQRLSASMAEWE